MVDIYSTRRWRSVRAKTLARDDCTCTVSRLLGGACSAGPLHVHHIIPVSEGGAPFDLSNTATTCSAHHPQWESLRRILERKRTNRPRCPHPHRSREAREICERRLAREALAA